MNALIIGHKAQQRFNIIDNALLGDAEYAFEVRRNENGVQITRTNYKRHIFIRLFIRAVEQRVIAYVNRFLAVFE